MENLNLIYSEIFISLSVMFLLILGVFKKNSSTIVHNLSLGTLLFSIFLTINHPLETEISLFNNSYKIDYLSSFMKILTLTAGIFVLITSSRYLKLFKIFQIEYSILILCSILGMMVMISSNDLIVFYIGLELQSLALYVLASFNRDQIKSSEAEKLIYDETISEGMIPKIKTCIDSVNNGVRGVVIIDGRQPHSILFELFSDKGSGTLIRK